jgi:phage gpG-like protein
MAHRTRPLISAFSFQLFSFFRPMEITFTAPASGVLAEDLSELIALAQEPALMEGIGTALASLARRSIDEPDLRASPWAPRKNRKLTHPLMRLTGELGKSPGVRTFTASTVTVGSDRPYFRAHQYGATIPTRHTGYQFTGSGKQKPKQSYSHLPARPLFPILTNGQLTPRAEQEVRDVVDAWIGNWRQGGA